MAVFPCLTTYFIKKRKKNPKANKSFGQQIRTLSILRLDKRCKKYVNSAQIPKKNITGFSPIDEMKETNRYTNMGNSILANVIGEQYVIIKLPSIGQANITISKNSTIIPCIKFSIRYDIMFHGYEK